MSRFRLNMYIPGSHTNRRPIKICGVNRLVCMGLKATLEFLFELYHSPGGVLGLEKGTNCGLTAAERWLLRREMAKKGGLSSYYIVR